MGLKMLLVLMVAMLVVNGLVLSYFTNGSLFATSDNVKAVEQSAYFGQNQDILTLEQNDESQNGDSAVSDNSDDNSEQTSNDEDSDSSSGGGSSTGSGNQEIPDTDTENNEDTTTDNTGDTADEDSDSEEDDTSDEPGAFEETEVRI
jgi:hypothetical protein